MRRARRRSVRRRVIYETFDAEMSDEDTSGGEYIG